MMAGWSLVHVTEYLPRYKGHQRWTKNAWFSGLLVDTGHRWKRGSPPCWSHRPVSQQRTRFAMAAAIGTHGTAGVAGQCQHSLPSAAFVDVSSRSPLEINKREMLCTLMTFPQWLSKTTAPPHLKLLRPWRGLEERVPTDQQKRGHTESTVWPLGKASKQGEGGGGDNQVFMWRRASRGQPWYCPHGPLSYPGLIVPLNPTHGHVAKPPQTPTRGLCTYLHQHTLTRRPVDGPL